jgi:hypothetical protein
MALGAGGGDGHPLTVARRSPGCISSESRPQISIAALIIALGMLSTTRWWPDAIGELAGGRSREIVRGWAVAPPPGHPVRDGHQHRGVLPLALLPGDKGAFILALLLVVTIALRRRARSLVTFIPLLLLPAARPEEPRRGGEPAGPVLF